MSMDTTRLLPAMIRLTGKRRIPFAGRIREAALTLVWVDENHNVLTGFERPVDELHTCPWMVNPHLWAYWLSVPQRVDYYERNLPGWIPEFGDWLRRKYDEYFKLRPQAFYVFREGDRKCIDYDGFDAWLFAGCVQEMPNINRAYRRLEELESMKGIQF